jgi:elongation factor Ts
MITAQMVKELREKTGAGMMECKKALTESNGSMDKAAAIIRLKGYATAVKKAERITAEGIVDVYVSDDRKSAGIVELNCETDFAASSAKFIEGAKKLARQASMTGAEYTGQFMSEEYFADKSITVRDIITQLIAQLGENISVSRFEKIAAEDGILYGYVHGSGRIGVIVELVCASGGPALLEAAKDIALQIAALNPLFRERSAVDEEIIKEKKKQFIAEAVSEGKIEKLALKIAEGRMQKYLKEVCLVDQQWVRNPDITISQYLQEKSNEAGAPITVGRYTRFERGGGAKLE